MHSERECEAPTRCRNSGGPHRSESRNCQARPEWTGPLTKEQLTTIRQHAQREYAAVARVKAAAERAEITSIAASKDAPI
ncbi:hypothetical protein K3495_g2928 [Podosphaera aphanis]|nr:hypothetical protein K3495_g2928 [Podosphaera aphanis]